MNNSLKYLIAEDSLHVCKGIKERTDQFPNWICCAFAHHIDEAIKLIKDERPQLIFLDWALKGGSAYDILREIENLHEYHPYIIFNTGYQSENPEIPQEIINNFKVDKYLIKPIWENLRINLARYFSEAEQKVKFCPAAKNDVWLTDNTRKYCRVHLPDLACIIQDLKNPHQKIFYFINHQKLIIKISWADIIQLLKKHNTAFFISNYRYSIITKNHLGHFDGQLVHIPSIELKVEITREKISAFKKWLEA